MFSSCFKWEVKHSKIQQHTDNQDIIKQDMFNLDINKKPRKKLSSGAVDMSSK